jgi:hypothetical protein
VSRISSTTSTFDWFVEILDKLDRPRRPLPFAVAGGGHEVEGRIRLDGARQVGQKRRSTLQHAHHHQLLPVQIPGNLCAHLSHALGNLLAGKENLKVLVRDGSHAHSIA